MPAGLILIPILIGLVIALICCIDQYKGWDWGNSWLFLIPLLFIAFGLLEIAISRNQSANQPIITYHKVVTVDNIDIIVVDNKVLNLNQLLEKHIPDGCTIKRVVYPHVGLFLDFGSVYEYTIELVKPAGEKDGQKTGNN